MSRYVTNPTGWVFLVAEENTVIFWRDVNGKLIIDADDDGIALDLAQQSYGPLIECDEKGNVIFDDIYWETKIGCNYDCE